MKDKEWTALKSNLAVDLVQLNEPVLCLLPGISKEKGWEYYRIFPKSVNIDKFQQFLIGLREANSDDKICIFIDNLTVHTSEKAKKTMRELGFKWMYNLAYNPETNPIEFVFSKVKHNFRNLRAKKFIGLTQDSHEALIHQAVKGVRKGDIVNCINHVIKLLK